MLLAIDSSTDLGSLALAEGDRIVAELSWPCGQNQTSELVPAVQVLLKQAKAGVDQLSAIAVARGPGSFNGLRAGISAAKALAYSRGIPLVSAGTLEVEAYQQALCGLPVCALLDAGRGEIAAALFRMQHGVWERLQEEQITTVDALSGAVREPTVFCGHIDKFGGALKDKLGELAVFPEPPALIRRAGYLAYLGRQKLARGQQDDPNTLQPLYLRQPPITQPKVKYPDLQGAERVPGL